MSLLKFSDSLMITQSRYSVLELSRYYLGEIYIQSKSNYVNSTHSRVSNTVLLITVLRTDPKCCFTSSYCGSRFT